MAKHLVRFTESLHQFSVALVILVLALGIYGITVELVQAQGSTTEEKIIISGASGQLGGLTVKELLERGVKARNLILVSRAPEKLEQYARLGASVRYGDFTEPESLVAAYAGGQHMLLISINSGGGKRPELHKNAMDAAVKAGVEHIAYTSFVNLDNNTSALATDHRRTEEYLKASGVKWTMLRNQIYADGLVRQAKVMVDNGRAVVPPDETRLGYVTRADCAASAAAVLSTPGHDNKAYDITGPELLGQAEIARAASQVTGKPIEIIEGDGSAGGFRLRGKFLSITSTAVEDLTGRPATGIVALLQANKDKIIDPE